MKYIGKLVIVPNEMRYEIRNAQGDLFGVLTQEYDEASWPLFTLLDKVVRFCDTLNITLNAE
jgi:hypothetical protein